MPSAKGGWLVAAIVAMVGAVSVSEPTAATALGPPNGFRINATNGYSVEVAALRARGGRPSEVIVFASDGPTYAAYRAPAKVTPSSFEADLGALGKVVVSYRATGDIQKLRGSCGRPISFAAGYYEGTIEFHGEGGFTDISTTWVPGRPPRLPCGSSSEAVGGRLPGARLSAFSWRPEGEFSFHAYKNFPRGPANFRAVLYEASGDVGIIRSVHTRGGPATFRYGRPQDPTAVVAPPAPFSGSGIYRRLSRINVDWTGNLKVDFPGKPDVNLVDSATGADLVFHTKVIEKER